MKNSLDKVSDLEIGSDIEKVEIGIATLYRGDCLEATKLINEQVHLSCCDPPYEATMHTADRMVKAGVDGWGTKTEAHKFEAMDEHTRSEITRLMIEKTKGWLMIFCQSEGIHYWKEAIEKHGGKYRFTGAWVKPSSKPNLSGDSPGLGFETVVSGWCGGGKSSWNGGGRSAVWTHNPAKRTADNNHTSIKPHSLMSELVGLFSNEGQTVLDTFMGSGSTGVAAVSMGRKFIGIERDPEYFEICCRRIEEAQKSGMFDDKPYVRVKSVITPMFEELKPKAPAPKVAAPKPRVAASAPKPAKVAPAAPVPKAAEPRKRFAPPTIKSVTPTRMDAPKEDAKPRLPARTIPASFEPILKQAAGQIIDFGPWTDTPGCGGAVGLDVECYRNFFLINFERFGNGQRISFELSDRSKIDFDRVLRILKTECIITYNGMVYDVPMVCMAAKGMGLNELKDASDDLIGEKVKYWQVEERFRIRIPTINHVDLFEPNPAVKTSLKTMSGRLHNKLMMSLPYKLDAYLSHEQMNVTTLYCFNDIADTKSLFRALREPLQLRIALGKKYSTPGNVIDFRSKSDAQVGEAVVKKRVMQLTGERIRKVEASTQQSFRYNIPPFISFKTEQLNNILDMIRDADFRIVAGKVATPEGLQKLKINIGDMTYSMGKGGLHSTEGTRALHSDDDNVLIDVDVAGHYPQTILKLGLYPKAIGKVFIQVYQGMQDDRIKAKTRFGEIVKKDIPAAVAANDDARLRMLEAEKLMASAEDQGGKIANNGVFGKLLSPYSSLNAPELGIATTVTGQLSVLMLIESAVAAGIRVASANTDGVLFYCPRAKEDELKAIIREWEKETGFEIEVNRYRSIYNSSVNTYIALKEDGKTKIKGPLADHWSANDTREMLKKNPQMTVLTAALLGYIKDGTPFEDTIRSCKDIRKFVTIIKVTGGGSWRGGPLGEVVRYYWSTDSDPILAPGGRKVAKTDGAKPIMELPDEFPDDVDYAHYVAEAEELANDMAILVREEELMGKRKRA